MVHPYLLIKKLGHKPSGWPTGNRVRTRCLRKKIGRLPTKAARGTTNQRARKSTQNALLTRSSSLHRPYVPAYRDLGPPAVVALCQPGLASRRSPFTCRTGALPCAEANLSWEVATAP